MYLRELPGVLSASEVDATVESILECQLPSGLILWFQGGHADPWNHVEAAMALDAAGHHDAAEKAYSFLAGAQLSSGSWYRYYTAEGVEDANEDANCTAYAAQGLWHHYLLTGDLGFLEDLWPVLRSAIEFVLKLQRRGGEVIWARRPGGRAWSYALLSSSSSIYSSLRAAVAAAERLGHPTASWSRAAGRLGEAIRCRPWAFSPRDRWAMDWYYPVLCGALTDDAARSRILDGMEAFVLDGWGVRCVSDKNWITPAETAETSMAFASAGMPNTALEILKWSQRMRCADGRYWTGIVLPERVYFPAGEKTTYSAAAQLLAAHRLSSSLDSLLGAAESHERSSASQTT